MSKQSAVPNKKGYFGSYGGCFVPEILVYALKQLEETYRFAKKDKTFKNNLKTLLKDYVGRPSPLYFAHNMSEDLGCKVYLKREDLNHTGAHKINNTIGQGLLATMMGKKRIIAETGAGQHGVATATVAALLGLDCDIYMGEEDTVRQALNVFRMEQLGARVIAVKSGTRTLKDATNEAMRDWAKSVEDTHYIIGSVLGPHPFPMIVRDFQAVIGRETRKQILDKEGRLPDYVLACVGGGSNAIGIFHPFFEDKAVNLIGIEAGGLGLDTPEHCATLSLGEPGVLHGCRMYLLQDEQGQVTPTHSVSAGLDYPGVGPEHSYYKDLKRAKYEVVSDREAMQGLDYLCEKEGILPALETAHAIAYLLKKRKTWKRKDILVINVSGRGDKDVQQIRKWKKDHS